MQKKSLKDVVLFTMEYLNACEKLNVSVLEKNIFLYCQPVFSLGECKIKNCLLQPITRKQNSLLQFFHALEITNPSLGSIQKTVRKFPNISKLKLYFEKTIVPIIKETRQKKIKFKKSIQIEISGSIDLTYVKNFLSYIV
jgi:hypothetical protein